MAPAVAAEVVALMVLGRILAVFPDDVKLTMNGFMVATDRLP